MISSCLKDHRRGTIQTIRIIQMISRYLRDHHPLQPFPHLYRPRSHPTHLRALQQCSDLLYHKHLKLLGAGGKSFHIHLYPLDPDLSDRHLEDCQIDPHRQYRIRCRMVLHRHIRDIECNMLYLLDLMRRVLPFQQNQPSRTRLRQDRSRRITPQEPSPLRLSCEI